MFHWTLLFGLGTFYGISVGGLFNAQSVWIIYLVLIKRFRKSFLLCIIDDFLIQVFEDATQVVFCRHAYDGTLRVLIFLGLHAWYADLQQFIKLKITPHQVIVLMSLFLPSCSYSDQMLPDFTKKMLDVWGHLDLFNGLWQFNVGLAISWHHFLLFLSYQSEFFPVGL